MDIIESLTRFSLTRQESTLYVQLLAEGAMTGYEAAKATGISRSNAYTSLAGLVDKGAACTVDGTPTKYVPVPAEEFLEKKVGSLQQLKNELIASLPDKSDREEAYITIKGEENICHKIESLIKSALQRVYISGEMPLILPFVEILRNRAQEGIKVVIITDVPVADPQIISYMSPRPAGQIGLITDSEAILTGEIPAQGAASCLFSRKKNLVDLFKTSLSNEIKLIELTGKTPEIPFPPVHS